MTTEQPIHFEEGRLYMIGHDDEHIEITAFVNEDVLIEYASNMFGEQMNMRKIKDWMDESSVDGDSYSAYSLYTFEDGRLVYMFGNAAVEFKNYCG
jgi:hypothetical protein